MGVNVEIVGSTRYDDSPKYYPEKEINSEVCGRCPSLDKVLFYADYPHVVKHTDKRLRICMSEIDKYLIGYPFITNIMFVEYAATGLRKLIHYAMSRKKDIRVF